ncbi:FeoB-associated Cys-rich membrane protein [Clostridium sp.]
MATAIIGTIVIGLFSGVAYYTYTQKKKGGSCCSGCKGCLSQGQCNK